MSLYQPVLQEFVDGFYDCVSASNLIGSCPQTCHLWKPQLMLGVGPLRSLKTQGTQKKGEKNWEGRRNRSESRKSKERKNNLRERKQENEED